MTIRILAFFIGLAVFGFAGTFIWTALRYTPEVQSAADGVAPTASVSETLSDGRLDFQVYMLEDRGIRLEIQFMPDAMTNGSVGLRPDVNFAMLDMHMDGINPSLELVEAGVWRSRLKLPMAGRWVVSVGFGEDRAEVEFDAK